MLRPCISLFAVFIAAGPLMAGDAEAAAISRNIQFRHAPFGTILDPIFTAPNSEQIANYTRCGDSALWTGHYLAAEAYRYNVTREPEALENAWRALSGLRKLVYLSGNNLLARCAFPIESEFAPGLIDQERHHGVYSGNYDLHGYYWIGNPSRDQYLGVFFGLATAWDLIADPGMNQTIADLVWRMLDYLDLHGWDIEMPDGRSGTGFGLRPDQKLALLAIGRHILPDRFGGDYSRFATFNFFLVSGPIAYDVLDVYNAYFKFNLDTITLYTLIRLENNPTRRGSYRDAYSLLRKTTDDHGNAHFNMLDHALNGPDPRRDRETVELLDAWLRRPRRDFGGDLRDLVPVCGDWACRPIPVELRVTSDFLWQRTPFQLTWGGNGFIENPGIDYILPYWMARYYGVIAPEPSPVRSPPLTQSSDDNTPPSPSRDSRR